MSDTPRDEGRKGPVLIDYSAPKRSAPKSEKPRRSKPADPPPSPADAPPIEDAPFDEALPDGRAMRVATALLGREPSGLTRWFLRAFFALAGFMLSVAAWSYINGLIAAHPILGWTAAVLLGAFVVLGLAMVLREWAAYARLRRIDLIHKAAASALANPRRGDAETVLRDLDTLYKGREEMDLPRARMAERAPEAPDAQGLIHLAEAELMSPLDAAARIEIEAASRTVATVTALVPLALADVVAALTANLRMIRRIAEIYGGRAGSFGNLRLARTVLTHLVATGAVAAGDDLIETMAGGGILSKLSRRFGEGVVNGALTARVGIAAIEVCRPLPFVALDRPRVSNIVRRALTGVFDRN